MRPAEKDLHAPTIPIVSAQGCCGTCTAARHACTHQPGSPQPAADGPPPGGADGPAPRLSGDPERIGQLLARLGPQVEAVFGRPVSPGAWLASLSLARGEAHLQLAPHLACHAGTVAELAFDAMRQVLPDTDLYIDTPHG
jgi:hypothetical protein